MVINLFNSPSDFIYVILPQDPNNIINGFDTKIIYWNYEL